MYRKLLVLLAFIALVAVVAYFRGWEFDRALFVNSFRDIRPGWLGLSIVLSLSTYWIRAFRWQALLAPIRQIRLQPLVVSTLAGFSAIYLLGRAGELVRPVWLARRKQVAVSSSIATIVVERFLDALMMILMLGAVLTVVDLPAGAGGGVIEAVQGLSWIVVAVSAGAIAALFVFRSNIDQIAGWIPMPALNRLLRQFAEGLAFLEHRRSVALAALHSVLLWVVIALQFWFAMLGMNFDLSLPSATFVMVFSGIGSVIQVPGIGGGFQAGFVFALTSFFGVPAERSTAASLVAWASTYIPTLAVAALYILLSGLSFRDLRVQPAGD